MIEFTRVTRLYEIKKGDNLILSPRGEPDIILTTAKQVKVSESDGVEVIFDLRKNKYFNVQMLIDGKSWIEEVLLLKKIPNTRHTEE